MSIMQGDRSLKYHRHKLAFKKPCKYLGAVALTSMKREEQENFVDEKLLEMKDVVKGVPLVIVITDEGVKLLRENESSVRMAHAISKIAFSTCHPEYGLFAYVVKCILQENTHIMQAHMFRTKNKMHSQQLNINFAIAFKIASERTKTTQNNRTQLFENEVQEKQSPIQIRNERKNWAKVGLGLGHGYSIKNFGTNVLFNSADREILMKDTENFRSSDDIFEDEIKTTTKPISTFISSYKGFEVIHVAEHNAGGTKLSDDFTSNVKKTSNCKHEEEKAEIINARMDLLRFAMSEDDILKYSEWYQPGFSREVAEMALHGRSIGSFFVRENMKLPGTFAMSVKVPFHLKSNGVAHFLIENHDKMFKLRGYPIMFPSLVELVAHYGSVQDDIPCQLRLANDNPLFWRRLHIDQPDNWNYVSDEDDSDVDSDYEMFSSNIDLMNELLTLRDG